MNKVALYIATHNTTGLKYFGKTTRYFTEQDLQENYHGSGQEWKKHLTKFGNNVTMEIYGIFHKDEVENKALTFSLLNDIVESGLWANMKPENGLDGGSKPGLIHTNETRNKIRLSKLNKPLSEERKRKLSLSRIGMKFSEEHKLNMSLCRLGKTLSKEHTEAIRKGQLGRKHTEETKKKMSETRKGVKQKSTTCPHCNKEGGSIAMKRWHFNNCKELSKNKL